MKYRNAWVAVACAAGAFFASSEARASDPATATASSGDNGGSTQRVPTNDPTGGAYTSPTLLFIPAGAMPVWNVRVTGIVEAQGPSDTAAAPNPDAGFRPGAGIEVGLPFGFAVAAGTNWVGGDVNPNTGNKDFNLGLSPFFQARFHIYGDKGGMGFQLGTSATYKFVGFEGDPGEMELAMSAQYRHQLFELGVQGVVGKDFGSPASDGEVHAYALYRVIPQLGIGGAGQIREGLDAYSYDIITGGIGSLTLGRYQIGTLIGGSTLGLDQGHFGAIGQLFASVRF